jgi:hypothetical protein
MTGGGGEDWYVPGARIVEDARTIRLHPPPHWRKDVLEVRRRTRSMNTNVGRGHWTAFQREKKAWQEEIEAELMVARTPRGNVRAITGVFIRFDRRMARPPDPGNYRTLIDKALGDALVNYGALSDDDDAHYVFGGVEFEEEIGPARTTIWLYTQPKEG